MDDLWKYGGLLPPDPPEVDWRRVAWLIVFAALAVYGLWWILNRRERPVRLVLGAEGCAAAEASSLPITSKGAGGGCEVRAVLLPALVLESLQSPPDSMYRLRSPANESDVAEVWLKKNLVVVVNER